MCGPMLAQQKKCFETLRTALWNKF